MVGGAAAGGGGRAGGGGGGVAGDVAVSYIHGGGRIGVIVAANGASDDAAREALTNIAMQVAAMNPTYISRKDITAEELA